jgi:aminoglycoside 6'-N-acetyltransferase I
VRIVDIHTEDSDQREQMARLLVEGFRVTAPNAWPTLESGREEVEEVLTDGFCRAALDESGAVLGWVGGLYRYGYVWELHPLVVDPTQQGQGVGRALVLDLEDQVRTRGGLTLLVGSDDEIDLTSLSGVNLYDDLPSKLAQAQGQRPHPLEFYRKLGYTLVGVVPDANGYDKPDILLAKRL